MLPSEVIAIRSATARYPERAPFHPDQSFPESEFPDISGEPNSAYASVRECFRLAGLDRERFGSGEWNPLRELMREGETVLLKPNLVKESHPRDPQGWQYVLTHGSIIRAVADYVWKAIGRRGRVIIADAPQTDSSWTAIVKVLGLDAIREYYREQSLTLDLIDLRQEEWRSENGVIVSRQRLAGDPSGAIKFDLGGGSEFEGHRGAGHYYGADYDSREVNSHHSNGRHEYLVAASVIRADVLFSLPKLKCHKKAGITVALKNLVGVNADKNWLPHHTEGPRKAAGDEHPDPGFKHRLERQGAALLRRLMTQYPALGKRLMRSARSAGQQVFGDTESVVRSGNWHGNDTIWRMCLDLNKIVLYGEADGTLRRASPENRKRHYVLVDGIVAGEGRGPMNPDPVEAGIVLFGLNPPSVDATAAWLMGFDPDKLPIVRNAFEVETYPLTGWPWRSVQVVSNVAAWHASLTQISDQSTFHFAPHFGWKGAIEREAPILV